MILYIVGFVLFIFLLYFLLRKKKEGYGAIKSFRRVPKNDCYNTCRQYYEGCMIRYQYLDSGDCRNRYDNCVGTCNYTDFHKM